MAAVELEHANLGVQQTSGWNKTELSIRSRCLSLPDGCHSSPTHARTFKAQTAAAAQAAQPPDANREIDRERIAECREPLCELNWTKIHFKCRTIFVMGRSKCGLGVGLDQVQSASNCVQRLCLAHINHN